MAELTSRASVSAPKSIEKEVEVVLNLVTFQSVALRLQNRESNIFNASSSQLVTL